MKSNATLPRAQKDLTTFNDVELVSLVQTADESTASNSHIRSRRLGSALQFALPYQLVMVGLFFVVVLILVIDEDSSFISSINRTNNKHNDGNRLRPELTRWTPSTDGACFDGFRTASTTIHCGLNDVSPVSNSSDDGVQYCGGVPMLPNYCLLPTSGSWEVVSTTTQPPTLPRRFGLYEDSPYNNNIPLCKSEAQYLNGTYQGERFDREWMPETCSSLPLDPFTWTQETKCQATITMMGDSHIRNLFTATVNGLRGEKSFAEAHPGDVVKSSGVLEAYEWRLHANGTASDKVSVFYNTNNEEPVPFAECPCADGEVVRCLRVAFIWVPTFREQLDQMHLVRKWNTSLVLIEPGNAYEHKEILSPAWVSEFEQLLDEKSNLHLGILHWNWGQQPFKEREAALEHWTTTHIASSRMSYFMQSSLQADGKQGPMTFHFACSLGQVTVVNDKIAAAEPCTDETDTAQMRAFATLHSKAFV